MTQKEVIKFFLQVKGKKIRITSWSNYSYFIPDTLKMDSSKPHYSYMDGHLYDTKFNLVTRIEDIIVVSNGFELNNQGYRWQFVDIIDRLDNYKSNLCTCSLQNLMFQGCKCGGR